MADKHSKGEDVSEVGRAVQVPTPAPAETTVPRELVVAVTGAGGGLGRAVALRFATAGALVACSDISRTRLAETVDLIEDAGGRATGHTVDTSDETELTRWRDAVARQLATPNVLVNSGGVLRRRSMADTTLEEFLDVVRVNLGGTYAAARTFAPAMAATGWGRIVNIASIAGTTGYPFSAYAASKAGVVNLTKSLVIDLWGTGVTVNAVCPGAMTTPMMDASAAIAMTGQTPSGALADPDDVAGIVEFLCSDLARNINGEALVVDGGATAFFQYASGGES